jgi:ribonuclease Z
MKVTVLGTGTPYPNPERFGSGILVEAQSRKILFDCGRGTVIRLSQAHVGLDEITDVYLTHLHSDHVTGLPDLWLTLKTAARKGMQVRVLSPPPFLFNAQIKSLYFRNTLLILSPTSSTCRYTHV